MKLGLSAGYWSSGPPAGIDEQLAAAEDLGFDSVWTAEAYGSDALTPLAWWGAKTKKLKLGTSIVQLSARTPAATAMAAMTMDHLSGGRFILGLGASGPQVVEGWYGQPYPRPLERTREYVDIMRRIFAREEPVEYSGHHYQLPYPGGMNLGKPLKSTIHPLAHRHPHLPRRRRPEERRARRGDRRWLAAALHVAEERQVLPRCARAKASSARRRATSPRTSKSRRSCPSS